MRFLNVNEDTVRCRRGATCKVHYCTVSLGNTFPNKRLLFLPPQTLQSDFPLPSADDTPNAVR